MCQTPALGFYRKNEKMAKALKTFQMPQSILGAFQNFKITDFNFAVF